MGRSFPWGGTANGTADGIHRPGRRPPPRAARAAKRSPDGAWGGFVAVRSSILAVGPAIIIDAAALGVGFGVLTLSQVRANARLGLLVVASLLSCLVATLALLPALISGRGTGDDRSPRKEPEP